MKIKIITAITSLLALPGCIPVSYNDAYASQQKFESSKATCLRQSEKIKASDPIDEKIAKDREYSNCMEGLGFIDRKIY
jgi:hypothetical protein